MGRKGSSGMGSSGSSVDLEIDEGVIEEGTNGGGTVYQSVRSKQRMEFMLHGGDVNTTSRVLRDSNVGSKVSYTETDPYDRSDTRTVTYTKTGSDQWKGSDNVGDRNYSTVSSRTVAEVAGGRDANATVDLKWDEDRR